MAQEKRAHARVAVAVNARLIVGQESVEYPVRDVSAGGIFLFSKSPPGQVGDVFTVELALTVGIKTVTVKGEIVRIVMEAQARGGGILGFALQFVQVTAAQQQAVVDMLDRSMLGPGTMKRAFPRVYHLLEVGCRTKTELKAMMRDIGEGGIGLTVDRRLEVNEEVEVEIHRARKGGIKLSGWVVSSEALPDQPGQYRVGVRFARLGAAREQLNDFIQSLYRGRRS